MAERELRYMLTEVRVSKGGKLSGYAARYNSDSREIPGVGIERILPGAFDRSLAAAEDGEQDITLNCSHNEMFTLGSVAMGNLRVSSDDKGLKFDVTPPNTEYAKAAVDAVKEGRMNKCSFSFVPIKEGRSSDGVRELRDVLLQHITICRPDLAAYPATAVEARSGSVEYRTVGDYTKTEARVYASVSEVPGYVPKDSRKQWMDIWNSAYKAAKAKGLSDKDAESKAFAEASGVIKKESNTIEEDEMATRAEQRAVKYLVKEDDGTEHLPVTDESGKPDHHLMGAAWAALHEGYRGNKYEGPNKQKAIEKLKAMYKSEDMPLPDANRSLPDQSELVGELRANVRSKEIDIELLRKRTADQDVELRDLRQSSAADKTELEELRMAQKASDAELRRLKEESQANANLRQQLEEERTAHKVLQAEARQLKEQAVKLPQVQDKLEEERTARIAAESHNKLLQEQTAKIPVMEHAQAELRNNLLVSQQQMEQMKSERDMLKGKNEIMQRVMQRTMEKHKHATEQRDLACDAYDQAYDEMERGMMMAGY